MESRTGASSFGPSRGAPQRSSPGQWAENTASNAASNAATNQLAANAPGRSNNTAPVQSSAGASRLPMHAIDRAKASAGVKGPIRHTSYPSTGSPPPILPGERSAVTQKEFSPSHSSSETTPGAKTQSPRAWTPRPATSAGHQRGTSNAPAGKPFNAFAQGRAKVGSAEGNGMQGGEARRGDRVSGGQTAGQTVGQNTGKPAGDDAKPDHLIKFQHYFKSVGPRTYAAQVKMASNGNHYLCLTEGQRDAQTGEVRKRRFNVFSEDFDAFFELVAVTTRFIRDNPVPDDVQRRQAAFWAKKSKTGAASPRAQAGRSK